MDKQLHIRILDALQQGNAVGAMVDIKPAFEDELDTQEKRKEFKAQIDYLLSQGLIETAGKFEFLGWELITGLYPLDKKKIEARLTGEWEIYLASKRGLKRDPVNLPPPAAPIARLGLYDAPTTAVPYPGIVPKAPPAPQPQVSQPTTPPPAALKPQLTNKADFVPFKAKGAPPAPHENPGTYLKEEDFLPFKNGNTIPAGESRTPYLTEEDFLPFKSRNKPGAAQLQNTPLANEPQAGSNLPPAEPAEFSAASKSYSPPRANIPPHIAEQVKPYTAPLLKPQEPPADVVPPPPTRITPTVKRGNIDSDAPIITARMAGLRPKQPQPTQAPATPLQQPAPLMPPAAAPVVPQRVVNLSSSAEHVAPPVAAPVHNNVIPPPPSNYAAVRFDTENNPFAGLGTIPLNNDAEKAKKPGIATILKWIVIVFVVILAVLAYVVYKKKYS